MKTSAECQTHQDTLYSLIGTRDNYEVEEVDDDSRLWRLLRDPPVHVNADNTPQLDASRTTQLDDLSEY